MAISPIIDIIDLEIGFKPASNTGLFYPLINISAVKGDFIGLIGRNGVGKSTFLRSIARLQSNLSGEVKIDGRENG
jgi:ABC-type cobalamin/Fe3+-siderophores transport system ATPase subunit